MSLRSSRWLFVLLLSGLLVSGGQVWAQSAASDSAEGAIGAITTAADGPRVTLAGWADRHRRGVLDQSHSYGGLFYDRGVFRRITPGMDREDAIDRATYRYTPGQERVWGRYGSGLRLRAGSLTRTQWGITTEIKHAARLAEGHSFRIDAVLQENFQAQRALLELGYAWTIAPRHRVGARHTFGRYKADLDASVFYRFGTSRTGWAKVELTALDVYHDLLYDVLGVWRGREEYTRNYTQHPVLAQFALSSPTQYPLRGELRVGWQRPSVKVVQSQVDESVRYRDRQGVHYLGALASYDLGPATVGLVYQRDQSSLDRLGLRPGMTSDYRTEQRFERRGAFVAGGWGPLRGSAWLFRGRYSDRQTGTDFSRSTIDQSMDWSETRTNLQLRAYYAPASTGWFAGVEYVSLARRQSDPFGVMKEQWAASWAGRGLSHYRGPVILGYRFGAGAVSLGINYDFDGDRKGDRFDNGFFRFVFTW